MTATTMHADRSTWVPGLLADHQILHLCEKHELITPFERFPIRERWLDREKPSEKVVSYGVGHYGYDIRVAEEFNIFTATSCSPVDPLNMPKSAFDVVRVAVDGFVLIPPNSFALARTVERFKIPRDVLGVVLGKSTYARCGLIVNCTPVEPEWEGYLTMEISNTTPLPAKVYANQGIAQILFYKTSALCSVSYADKKGKYQNQPKEIVLPRG